MYAGVDVATEKKRVTRLTEGRGQVLGARGRFLSGNFRNYANAFDLFRRWRAAPHPPSFLGHPLPPGERVVARWKGSEPHSLTLSARGRGWPAAGAFISRGGPGEGAGNTLPNLRNEVLSHQAELTAVGRSARRS